MSSDAAVLQVSNVSKCYTLHQKPVDKLIHLLTGKRLKRGIERWVLRNISLELAKGDSLGIIGVNGSGKSTLLQIIAGTLKQTHGDIRISGKVGAILELGAGFNTELTGRENLEIMTKLHGIPEAQIVKKINQIIAFAQIGEYIDHPVKTYSSGMFVRLAFSLMIHIDADVLIVDEALAVGDASFNQKCTRFFEEFRKRGTLILVSHDLATVRSVCDRCIWLENGEVRADGDPRIVGDQYLESRYELPTRGDQVDKLPLESGNSIKSDGPGRSKFEVIPVASECTLAVIEKFQSARKFGTGAAQITDAFFLDDEGHKIANIAPGKSLTLRIEAEIQENVGSLIFGYFIRNKNGLNILGDNTFLYFEDNPPQGTKGENWYSEFTFEMPLLPRGEYSLSVAIAQGTNVSHTQLEWIHDAIFLESMDRSVHADVLAVPPKRISMGIMDVAA